MAIKTDILSFRDYNEFAGLIADLGEVTAISEDGFALRCDAPFASVRCETYQLFGSINLSLLEMLPRVGFDFHYELDPNYFEIGYVTEGSFHLVIENYSDNVICPAHLYISPPSGSQGRITCFEGRPLRTVSFFANRADGEVTRDLLGENGCRLWEESIMARKGGTRDSYHLTTPPPDVLNSLLRAANCNYPHRVKTLFFENVFREVLLRLIAHELPDDETSSGMDSFDAERIKSVPGTLMARLDSPPSIAELARELSINATKLQGGFKKIFGKSIYAYHHGMCLERAAVMLLDTDKPIFEIAMDAGYSGSGNFCNAFKKRYGVSPSLYRQKGGRSEAKLPR